MLPGYPRPGDRVLFKPPEHAYSAGSAQSHYAGEAGVVYRVFSDSYAVVQFDRYRVLVNTSYLELLWAAKTLVRTR